MPNQIKNLGKHVAEYVYDFSVDGGVKDSAIVLSSKNGKEVLPQNAIVTGVSYRVITAVEGTSSTVIFGNTTDADGYSGATIAEATLVADYVGNGWDNAAPLLWDDTNDHPIHFLVNSANDANFTLTIGTADLTAGKIAFYVEYFLGSVNE
jgi:hypothetical protein